VGDGIRVDSYIEAGSMVPPYYDSMIAKVIARGTDRKDAIDRLRQALSGTSITGISTNIAFQAKLLADAEFAAGGVDTGYLARLGAREPTLFEV